MLLFIYRIGSEREVCVGVDCLGACDCVHSLVLVEALLQGEQWVVQTFVLPVAFFVEEEEFLLGSDRPCPSQRSSQAASSSPDMRISQLLHSRRHQLPQIHLTRPHLHPHQLHPLPLRQQVHLQHKGLVYGSGSGL